jgi:hypothetical protein
MSKSHRLGNVSIKKHPKFLGVFLTDPLLMLGAKMDGLCSINDALVEHVFVRGD